jgi:hypothetical protein
MRTTCTLTASVDDPPCCHPSDDLVVQPTYESGPSNAIAANESAVNSIVIIDETAISDKDEIVINRDAIDLSTLCRC